MSLSLPGLYQNVDRAQAFVVRHPRSTTSAVLGLLSGSLLYRNYRAYIALGKGGLPHNVKGWVMALALKLCQNETLSTHTYDQDENKEYWLDAAKLARRKGSRPASGFHVVPARQLSQLSPPEMRQRTEEMMNKVITSNSHLVTTATSPHEAVNEGILIHPSLSSPHDVADVCFRKIAHLHRSEHSLHVVLSPQDCKTVISHGWGERHKLSGSQIFRDVRIKHGAYVPKEYIWIYAPRDDEELAVVEKIVEAAIGYMTGMKAKLGVATE